MEEVKGCTEYKGFTASQHPNFVEVFEKFLTEVKPKRILEIGTSQGGTTLALNDIMKSMSYDYEFRSYDIYDIPWYDVFRSKGVDIRVENLFNHSYDNFDYSNPSKITELTNFIGQDGVTVILCDGGHKKGEFNLLSQYLKKGDYIMAHDFAWSQSYFEEHINNKIWNWCEITGDDIADSMKINNLVPYMKDEFQSVVWCCTVKQ